MATVALATAFTVVACGSNTGNGAAPVPPGSHNGHAGRPPAPTQPLRAGERFVDLKMVEAYTPAPPEGGGTDEYRCQVIDPGLTKAAFLTGTQATPENVALAHHAIVCAVLPPCTSRTRRPPASAGSVSAGPACPAPKWKKGRRRGWTPGRSAVRLRLTDGTPQT
ncbi:hypothetical protein SK854_04445 [Lentzea sp. BCCO 10_0061]|uniref:Lipoprotein n=1 Tax=Lentzea sokolovensis TaxID=3095429 RepID=A0ABU4URL7_9PSEU|nr:hypothetical protein [Lentzea sp. BCCO 10_0061]MDX8141350.1 hypothetical protein [Lentzea sp. BCCO 10_0061]